MFVRNSLACAIGIVVCGAFSASLDADERPPYREAAHVCVEPTIHDYLSGPTFNIIRDEASRIWLRHGVALTWDGPAATRCDALIPLVFDEKALKQQDRNAHKTSLARTVFLGRTQAIYLSVPRAFVMVKAILPDVVSSEWQESRGGTLLGRVVAHELGHVLLMTTSHATSGLMRPIYGLRDVLSDDEKILELSAIETRTLATRFSLTPIEPSTTLALIPDP